MSDTNRKVYIVAGVEDNKPTTLRAFRKEECAMRLLQYLEKKLPKEVELSLSRISLE